MTLWWRALATIGLALTLTTAARAQDCHLKAGLDQWAPYQYQDSHNRPAGLDVDLLRLYGRLAGCRIEFQPLPWSRQLRELRRGQLDLLPGASRTPDRRRFAHFSQPYRKETMRLFMTAQAFAKYHFKTFRQMVPARFRLGVTLGYYYGDSFRSAMHNPAFRALVVKVPDMSQNFRMLEAGHVEGAIADSLVGDYWIRKLKLQGRIVVAPMTVNDDDIYMMFSRKTVTPALVRRFNQAIRQATESGAVKRILERYHH